MNIASPSPRTAGKLAIPIAIVIAGGLIAGAIFINGRNKMPAPTVLDTTATGSQTGPTEYRAISANDHILGSPDAPIKIIEYSDTECPFCKDFHVTLHRIMDEYGRTGQVAWIYRHFPLEVIHKKAPYEAQATECAAELGGNSAFWAYIDKIFEITPSNDGLDLALLPQIAVDIGLDRNLFEDCLESGRTIARVQDDFDDARRSGADGTPYSIILAGASALPLNGAQPYSAVKGAIDAILTQLEAQ